MILCLYGRTCAEFVEPVVRDLRAAAEAIGGEVVPITVERAIEDHERHQLELRGARRLYVLPFDVPSKLPADAPTTPAALVRWLFPGAEALNPFDVHEICWDKPTVAERWLQRGVRVPDGLLTSSVEEATAFVEQHEWVILKATRSCGGHGHYVVSAAADGLVAEARGQRYELELVPPGGSPQIRDRQLRYPGPFYFQRLVAEVGPRNVMSPGQLLRAYLVDGQIAFWIERYRPRYRRPSDWIVTTGSGAKYRFLFSVGEEARKMAMRAADVIGLRLGVIDLVRTAGEGVFVLAAYSDGHHMMIDRQFKRLPEFRDAFDFERFIAEALLAEPAPLTRPIPADPALEIASKRRERRGHTESKPPRFGNPPPRRARGESRPRSGRREK
jgi:hypothetical protein